MGLDAATAESVSVIGVLIALTVLQVIVGELVPKSIALQHPTRTALLTAVPMRASWWLLRWFIAAEWQRRQNPAVDGHGAGGQSSAHPLP